MSFGLWNDRAVPRRPHFLPAFRIEDEPDAASAGKPDGSSPYKRRSQEVSVGYSKRREREEKRYRARDPMNTEKPTDAVKSKAENDSTANGKEATQVRQPIGGTRCMSAPPGVDCCTACCTLLIWRLAVYPQQQRYSAIGWR